MQVVAHSIPVPEQDVLMKYFSYDEGDSAFPLVWKVNKGPARVGMRAGTMRKDGYVTTKLNSIQYLMHRLVWSINGNSFTPGFVVDHKEGNPSENLIGDLQEISHAANLHKANYSRVSSRSTALMKPSGSWVIR